MNTNEDFYTTICRVCLSYGNKETMVPLVTNSCEYELSNYGKAVTTFANIVLKFDSLPNKMCQNCLLLLRHAIIFKIKCENSHETLMRMIKRVGACDLKVKEAVSQYVMFLHCFGDLWDGKSTRNEKLDNNDSKMEDLVEKSEVFLDDGFDNELETDEHIETDIVHRITDSAFKKDNNIDTTNSNNHEKEVDSLLTDMEKLIEMDVASVNEMVKEHNKINNKNKQKGEKEKIKHSSKFIWKRKEKATYPQTPKAPQRNIPCKFCNKVLANIHTWKNHMQLHTGRRYICDMCGKGYSVKAEVEYHQAAVHKHGKLYDCSHCDYKAPRRMDLAEHERIHTGERPFACEECGLTFRRQYHWRKHTIIHKEKTVKCIQCPQMFYLKGDMMAHYNNVHDRIYVYACDKCNVTYAKTKTVRSHLTKQHGIPRESQGKIRRIVLKEAPKLGKS